MNNSRLIVLSQGEPVDMADEWYEFALDDHFWMQWRLSRILMSHGLKQVPEGRWLDIGCGNGSVIKQFETNGDYIIDGMDLNMMALEQIGPTRGDIFVYNIFDNYLAFKNKYAGILLLDVIEHIDDDGSFLEACLINLMPGGIVIINVPAVAGLFSKYDVAAGHKRRYSKKMVHALFNKYDIEELDVAYWGVFLLPFVFVRKFLLFFVSKKNVIKTGFQPPIPIVNSFFKFLMKIEISLFKNPPLGTSVIGIGRKPLK